VGESVKTYAAGRTASHDWTPDLGSVAIAGGALVLAAAVVVGRGVQPAAALLIVLSAVIAWHRWMFSWYVLLCGVIGVVLFVPVGRYSMAIPLPFGLELYRVAVALVLLIWIASLLIDPSVRLRRTPLDAPVVLIVVASLSSVAVNFGRVAPLATAVLKALTLFLSFIIFYYFVSSVVKTVAGVIVITKFLVSGVAIVAFFAIVEQRTGFNIFDHVRSVFPFVRFEGSITSVRFGLIRAVGSADHPIALGVMFASALPPGIALAKGVSRVWWLPTFVILIGVLATASRTPILALMAATFAFAWLRPRDILPLLPLAVPMLIVIKIAAPGSVATVKNLFFPPPGESLIASQRTLAGDPTLISGRANLLPRIADGMRRPMLGQGVGTRQTGDTNPLRNAPILDNQWLGLFLDVGLVGLFAWMWLMVRSIRHLGRVARTRGSPDGLLAAAFVASIAGFAVAMFTYDSLAFVQETFVFWTIMALGATLVAVNSTTGASRESAT
jgi:hypothetical protein